MPKVSEINLGTEIVNPVRPEVDDGMEPTQCANGHWTTTGDLDENDCCSQCPVEEVEKDPILEADRREELYRLIDDYEDYYDDGKD
jgi:hypothetical protein